MLQHPEHPPGIHQCTTSRGSTSSGATTSEEIDTNQCCVCFQTYTEDVLEGTGLEWVKCAHVKWLHEACILYIAIDVNGKVIAPIIIYFGVYSHCNTV